MQIHLGNFVLVAGLGISGVAALLWILGNPEGRVQLWVQRWVERTRVELAEARRLARQRREAEARGDLEMLRIRAIADRELKRLSDSRRRHG